MRRMLRAALDICFPPRPEERRVRTIEMTDLTLLPRSIGSHVALLDYTDDRIKALIHEAKFFNNRRAQSLLGTILADYLSQQLEEPFVLIPIPLSAKRQRSRGYNQVSQIINTNPLLKAHCRQNLIKRHRHTTAQTSLTRADRLTNLASAFTAAESSLAAIPAETTLIVVDDVTTTGATLQAATQCLSLHTTAPIYSVALAH